MKLIIRADDVGYTDVCNIGAFETRGNGLVTAADVMLETPGAEDALRRLKDMPWISTGWHTHFWGSPLLAPARVPSLYDPRTGHFRTDIARAADVVYEEILARDYSQLDVEACLGNWRPLEEECRIGEAMFAGTKFPDLGVKAAKAKFIGREETRARLERFKSRWPEIRARLVAQLVPSETVERKLRAVGAPVAPEEIGSTVAATLADARKTVYMRDRYMSLDFLSLTGELDLFARRALGCA